MKLTVGQLLELAFDAVAEAAPDGLKKNSTLRHLGQLMTNVGDYANICAQIPEPTMSGKGLEALARAERTGKLWIRKDCGCK